MAAVVVSHSARTPPSPHALLPTSPLVRPARLIFRIGLALFTLGILCRAVRYFLQFPFWGDEGMLATNFLDRDYLGLTKTLDNWQVAPILFLWSEATVFRLLGGSEWAMRLLPFLASLGALFLFWRLAHLTLPPLAATFAVGLLAVARWPVTMGAVVKPYSFDLFFSLALIVVAVYWLKRPQRVGWLALLAALVPVALLASYPTVFVAGAVSVALLPRVWERRGTAVVSLFLAYNVLMIASFLACILLVGREQLGPATGHVQEYMRNYWADGFPPAEPLALLRWLALIHTGRLMAYPVGDSDGGSTLTFLLFLAGVWRFWRDGRRTMLVLLLTPFALNLFAAVIHRYPYGGCCRLSQHVAPAICLLAGCGIAAAIERLFARQARLRAAFVVCGLLVLCGVIQLFVDAAHPYRDDATLWTHNLARVVDRLAEPNDRVVVLCDPKEDWSMLRWQLERNGRAVAWNDAAIHEQADGRVWLLAMQRWEHTGKDEVPPGLRDNERWVCVASARFALRREKSDDPKEWCTLSCYARPERAQQTSPPMIPCWPK